MSIVDQIRYKLPLAAFVAPHTNGLKPSGKGFFIGRCPFHQDPTDPPSKRAFWVNAELNICGCFKPGCQAGHPPYDVINFWARLQGISNSQAIEELASRIGLVKT